MISEPNFRLEQAEVGQRVSFVYQGGSNPGARRLVDIESLDFEGMYGMDVDKQEPRQFLYDHVATVEVVRSAPEEVEEVADRPVKTKILSTSESFVDIRKMLIETIDAMDGEELARATTQLSDCDSAKFDPNNGQITMGLEVYVPHFVRIAEGLGVNIVNEQGETMSIVLGMEDSLTVNNEEVTPEELLDSLTAHLGG